MDPMSVVSPLLLNPNLEDAISKAFFFFLGDTGI
jgi:hypothetical protein